MYRLLRPVLFALPPETAHALTLKMLSLAHSLQLTPRVSGPTESAELLGLHFPNRLGLAAGLDKNGDYIDALGTLGFGFIEIGTVTPQPQSGNPTPRLFRLVEDDALINRMGFPNDGVVNVCKRLRERRYRGVLGVNVGKNASTPLHRAAEDYIACVDACHSLVDYIALNISSPNTAELRQLQHGERLRELLTRVVVARDRLERDTTRRVLLFVKLSADLADHELIDAARIAASCGIDGVIATNTSVERIGLRSPLAREEGGLSGAPLRGRALRAVALVREAVGPKIVIIGVGGIASAHDVAAMRAAGADLVQVYTGLVYRGPALAREILRSGAIA